MKFIFRWLGKKIKESSNSKYPRISLAKSEEVCSDSDGYTLSSRRGTTFKLYKADGGHVVETSYYDANHDHHQGMYLITEDQNLGERISHIITYEGFKR
jgi:hypothetical protein